MCIVTGRCIQVINTNIPLNVPHISYNLHYPVTEVQCRCCVSGVGMLLNGQVVNYSNTIHELVSYEQVIRSYLQDTYS